MTYDLAARYVAETLPPDAEESCSNNVDGAVTSKSTSDQSNAETTPQIYRPPPPYPKGQTLKDRIALDTTVDAAGQSTVYEPLHHENTAQDEEEACYQSHLLPIDEARRLLKGSVQEDVIRRGWEGIQWRMKIEAEAESS